MYSAQVATSYNPHYFDANKKGEINELRTLLKNCLAK